ncbi:TRAP transporter small permease [Maritalea sp. S77]|uniref:TRAP transporter small permease n=1 Tax=Maritalea sp. S77 TaxID=3415125 RepID=UPI003C7A82C7
MIMIAKTIDGINVVAEFVCHRLLELIVCVTFLQVVMRYVFSSPTKWSEETAMICLVWYGMIAAAICVRRHQHIAITFFRDLAGPRIARFLDIAAQVAAFIFALVLIYSGLKLTELTGAVKLPASGFPKSTLYMSALAGGALICLNVIANLITNSLDLPGFQEGSTSA